MVRGCLKRNTSSRLPTFTIAPSRAARPSAQGFAGSPVQTRPARTIRPAGPSACKRRARPGRFSLAAENSPPRQTLAPRSTTARALHSIGLAMSRLPARNESTDAPAGPKDAMYPMVVALPIPQAWGTGEETANARLGQAERAPAWWEGQTRRGPFLSRVGSKVEIEEELVGYRPQVHRGQLAFALVGDPGLDNVLGEHVALEKEFMVTFQCVEHLAQRARGAPDLLGFLGLEVVQVLVDRIARVDLVLD